MSYAGRRIWYIVLDDGQIVYSVAKGDGTDEYFTDYRDAFEWIEKHKRPRG